MSKFDLPIRSPLLNAAGTLGFAPNPRGPVDLAPFGGFVTNPVSLAPRTPAETRACIDFPGGFLLHTGLPNPGLRAVLKNYAARWAGSALPIFVHLLADSPGEVAEMVSRLEGLEGVMGVEIGLPPQVHRETAADMAFAAVGELAVVVSLPPERLVDLGPYLLQAGVETVSLAAPRGALPGPNGRLVPGRLFGPALLPGTLSAVLAARQMGFDVIASGGLYTPAAVDAALSAGAFAVQLDSVLWRGYGMTESST